MSEQAACQGCHINSNWKYENDVYKKFDSIYESSDFGLTENEKEILNHLVEAWNLYKNLPKNSINNLNEYLEAIHRCQQLIALRVARRVDPDVWAQPGE